jgi:hypothetical protein
VCAIPTLLFPNSSRNTLFFYVTLLSAIYRLFNKKLLVIMSKVALSPFGNAVAGAGGAIFSLICVYPLDM